MGRKKLEVDWEHVQELASMGCTVSEVALELDVSEDTLLRRCREEHDMTVYDYLDLHRDRGRTSLRRAMYNNAMEGNVTAQIFLAKQREWLGMTDKHQVETDVNMRASIQAVTFDLTKLSDAELEQLEAIQLKALNEATAPADDEGGES